MSRSVPNRSHLNKRVDASIKNAYEETIRQKYGSTDPYAAIELERELRYFVGEGDLHDLSVAIDELAQAVDTSDDEKNNSGRIRSRTETTVLGYHVDDAVQHKILNNDDYRSTGELIEDVMASYIEQGNVVCRQARRINRLVEKIDSGEQKTDDQSAVERRMETIIQQLPSKEPFSIEDFEDAVDNESTIDSSEYIKNKYLPKVVDRLGYTWHPDRPDFFVNENNDWIPEYRDPRNKPKWLMTEEDERLAIKIDAFYAISGLRGSYSVDDARVMLNSNPQKSDIKRLMQDIADDSPGYKYNSKKEKLAIKRKKVKKDEEKNWDVLVRIDIWN